MVLVLDRSGSMNQTGQGNAIAGATEFATNIAAQLDLRPDHSQAAVVSFATNTSLDMLPSANMTSNASVIQEAIQRYGSSSPPVWGLTDVSGALLRAKTILDPVDDTTFTRIVLVMTDGEQSLVYGGSSKAKADADILKDAGITVFAVGFGNTLPMTLDGMASEPTVQHSYLANDVGQLISYYKGKLCEFLIYPPSPPPLPPQAPPEPPAHPPMLPPGGPLPMCLGNETDTTMCIMPFVPPALAQDLWWLLLLLLPLLFLLWCCCKERRKQSELADIKYLPEPDPEVDYYPETGVGPPPPPHSSVSGVPEELELEDGAPASGSLPPPGAPPLVPNVVAGGAAAMLPPPQRRQLSKPQSQQRLVSKPSGQELKIEDVQANYRWDVDVGKYYWKRSGMGASGALNVGWGNKGGTSSTPIVVKETVEIENDLAAAAAPRDKKVVKRSKEGALTRLQRSMSGRFRGPSMCADDSAASEGTASTMSASGSASTSAADVVEGEISGGFRQSYHGEL